MIEEIYGLSQQIGIGFFLLYEDKSTYQKSISYLKKFSDNDLTNIIKSLQESNQKLIKGKLSLQEITKSNNTKQQIISEIKQCLQKLYVQRSNRVQRNQMPQNIQKKKAFIFNTVQMIIIGILVILFTLSLFSDNSWTDQNSIAYKSQKSQSSPKDAQSRFTYQQKAHQQKINKPLPEQKSIPIVQSDTRQQQQFKSETYFQTKQNSNFNQSISSMNHQANGQNVTFSTYQIVETPLVFSYEVIAKFSSHQTALFICEYILFYVFWVLAIFLFILQLFLSR